MTVVGRLDVGAVGTKIPNSRPEQGSLASVAAPHAAVLSDESLDAVRRSAALEMRWVLVGERALDAVNDAGPTAGSSR